MAAEKTGDPAAPKSCTHESTVDTSPHVNQNAPESSATNGSGGMRDEIERKDVSATPNNPDTEHTEQPTHPVDDSKVTNRKKKVAAPMARIVERGSETDRRYESDEEGNEEQATKEFEEWMRKERVNNDSLLHSSNQLDTHRRMANNQSPLDTIMMEMSGLSTDASSEVRIERMMNNMYYEINEVDSWLKGLTKLPEEEELMALREARDKVIDQLGRDMLMEFESNDKAWEKVEREWIERYEKEKKAKEGLILVMEEIKEITGHKGSIMSMKETTRILQNKVQFLLNEQERLRQEVQRLATENREQKMRLSSSDQTKGNGIRGGRGMGVKWEGNRGRPNTHYRPY